MSVGLCQRLVGVLDVRVVRRRGPRALEVVERAAVVAAAPAGPRDCGVDIGVHAGVTLGLLEDGQRLLPRAAPRQRGGEPDARVDVAGMFGDHRAEERLGLVDAPEPEVEAPEAIPQFRFGISRIQGGETFELLEARRRSDPGARARWRGPCRNRQPDSEPP